jgi:hypothetical protein
MYLLKIWSTNCWFVHIREKCKRQKHQSNCSNPSKFIRNSTQNSINSLEIPFRYNVCRSRVRICRDIVIRVSQSFRIKSHQKSCRSSQCLPCHLIFCIKVGVEVNYIACCINTQGICRSILMQCCEMYQGLSSQQERKQVMKTVETVQSGVINTKATPLPPNNRCTHYWQSTCQTCNYCSSPKRHLTPWQYITNECC